jgi:Fe2+ or Zn2+ uptake regulation protein
VICTECEKIEEIQDCRLAPWERKVAELGYTRVRHVLEFRGICRDCAAI